MKKIFTFITAMFLVVSTNANNIDTLTNKLEDV